MNGVQGLIHYHPAFIAIIAFWFFSNAVATMPTPDSKSGKGYIWLFGLLHAMAGSLPRLVATLAPGSIYAKFLTGNGGSTNAPPKQP